MIENADTKLANDNKEINKAFYKGLKAGSLMVIIPSLLSIVFLLLVMHLDELEVNSIKKHYDFSNIEINEGPQKALEKKFEFLVNNGIKNSYFGFRSKEECEDIAAKAIMLMLNDDYAAYYNPKEAEQLLHNYDKSYNGIGITIGLDQNSNRCVIMDIVKNSSAYKAGIQTGDIIMKVNDTVAERLNTSEIAKLVKNSQEKTKLTLLRQGKLIEVEVKSDKIVEQHIEYSVVDNKFGYIKLDAFSGDCVYQTRDALVDIISQLDKQGYILDLRGNPGGELDKALSLMGYFVGKDELVTYFMDSNNEKTEYRTDKYTLIKDNAQVVVLVNSASASASEMMAGALRDILGDRVKIVGATTYGKGIAQQMFRLGDGSVIKYTTEEYFTPNGTKVHGIGIHPDIEVYNSGLENKDEQYDIAVSTIKEMMN